MEDNANNLWLAELWLAHRDRISRLLEMKMPPVLRRRLSVEDLTQEVYMDCGRRLEFLQAEPDVPMTVTNSPRLMANDTPRKACTVSSPTTKSRRICSSRITSSIGISNYRLQISDYFPQMPQIYAERYSLLAPCLCS